MNGFFCGLLSSLIIDVMKIHNQTKLFRSGSPEHHSYDIRGVLAANLEHSRNVIHFLHETYQAGKELSR